MEPKQVGLTLLMAALVVIFVLGVTYRSGSDERDPTSRSQPAPVTVAGDS